MHNHIVNASLQVVPIVQCKHPYRWVDETTSIIHGSGIRYEVNAFATVIEGAYREVLNAVDAVNEHLNQRGCEEWILNVQIQIRAHKPITVEEKTSQFR